MPKTTPWREVRKRLDLDEQAVARERLRLRLAILREQLGKSQVELAELLGTSQPNLNEVKIFSCHRSRVTSMHSVANFRSTPWWEIRPTG
jgi:predicted XRE-type DNA-binding protein